ncbi:MAG: PQQ-dependent sugar dehydrogenase [Marmoricola sp.]|nr:PQQ-dependent sugar dehydrogenase [Marmoricola sp.]
MRRTRTVLTALLTATLLVPAGAASSLGSPGPAPAAAARAVPRLSVTTLATGLDIPWDVQALPDGRLLLDERTRKRLSVWDRGVVRPVSFPASSVWAAGETGLMGLAVDPAFASNHRFYTCQGAPTAGGHEVAVKAWTLDAGATRATSAGTLLHGLPSTSGRHGGCRLLIARNGSLLVGTGDAAVGTNPRNKRSLGGKTLRLDRSTGRPWPANPYIHAARARQRYVLTNGHRNVQGLAQRSDGTLWSVEQGTTRDDEVNQLVPGSDYGYNPVPGYNEKRPMTDHGLPGAQRSARWRSGSTTLATSGGTWVPTQSRWGAYSGTLAVAALKAQRMLFMTFDANGVLRGTRTPAELQAYGRLRSVTPLPNGDLLVTTANGGGQDRLLRVAPTG